MSKIELFSYRKSNFRDCFKGKNVDVKYPVDVNEIDDFLESYQRKKADYNENYLGEDMVLDRLIVMDDVSGLTDRSEAFANFLTVSRKYGLTCVYIFHTIYLTRQHWQMILPQTKIFNFFLWSVQASAIIRIVSLFCSRYKHNYLPHKDFWINQLYYDISNSTQKPCLTIDIRDVNDLGPDKLGHRLTTVLDKFAITIKTKEILVLILSLQQEKKHHLLAR